MNDRVLRAYHRLPAPMKSLVATARGYYLRLWRYGADTETMIADALAREGWPRERWAAYEAERLTAVLRHAAATVPFYRDHWSERRRLGDHASADVLQNWPILDKEVLRQSPRAFLSDSCTPRLMFQEHTSGTTGKPIDLWQSRGSLKVWYALSELRWRRWYGVSGADRWGILGGQLVTPVERRQPPFWVWNRALNQLYLSSYHLSPALIPHYLDALKAHRVTFLLGYTSSLYALAQEALRLQRRDLKMTVVIANAEPVFDYQREAIERAFSCPLRETYGMAEMVAAGSECEAGRLHLWPEMGHVEVLEGSEPVAMGDVGDFVCTGLTNPDMPLIRYRVGDRGAVRDERCRCGRGLPLIVTVEGRADDVLFTSDGRRVGRLDPVFKASLPVREAQIVQEGLDTVRIRYVPAPEFSPADARSMVKRLRDRMGPIDVILEPMDEIPRTSSGKFRAVICRVPPEEIARRLRLAPVGDESLQD